MTPSQRISAYNRLQGIMTILDELIGLYHPPVHVLDDLQKAQQWLHVAQRDLEWIPAEKTIDSRAK